MGREDDVREIEQLCRHVGLVHEHVQPGPNPSGDELGDERLLFDDLASCRVHEGCAVAEQGKPSRVDEAHRLRGQRHVDAHDVRLREQRVELAVLGEIGLGAAALRVEHPELEALGAPRDRAPDPPQPDDPERGARELVGHEALRPGRAPAARAHQAITFHHAPPGREDQREREVGGRVVEHARRVRDDDAPRGARRDVDPVVADAEVRDDPEAGKQVERHGLVGDDERPRRPGAARRASRAGAPRHREARRTLGRDSGASPGLACATRTCGVAARGRTGRSRPCRPRATRGSRCRPTRRAARSRARRGASRPPCAARRRP